MLKFFFLASLILMGSSTASARVFNYKEASVAPYVRATGGYSSLRQSAFGNSSGADTSIDATSKYDYSGELGVMVALSSVLQMRLGAELMQNRPVSQASGFNPSGVERFKLDSDVSAFNPNVTFEYAYKAAGNMRYYALLGGGLATVTVVNKYTMTTQGTTDLGVTDFTETMAGSAVEGHLGVGFEALFTDNVTFSCDLGYRYLNVKTLKYKSAVNNIVSTSGVAAGDQALNSDGSARTLNLGGLIVGFGFRFYLNFL